MILPIEIEIKIILTIIPIIEEILPSYEFLRFDEKDNTKRR